MSDDKMREAFQRHWGKATGDSGEWSTIERLAALEAFKAGAEWQAACDSQNAESDTQEGLSLTGDTQTVSPEAKAVISRTAASLMAAISLLEDGGREAAPSDKMFSQMIEDYKRTLADAREFLSQPSKQQAGEPVAWIVRRYEECVGICPDRDEAERLASAMNAEVYPLYTAPQPQPDWVPYLMLAEFGRQCFQMATTEGGGDIEWEQAFDIAQEIGMLVPEQRDEPCYAEGSNCVCDDVGVDFPTTFYRPTPLVNGLLWKDLTRPQPPEDV